MPDWRQLVEQRLAALNLPPRAKQEVIAELAAHLEDSAVTGFETAESEDRELAQVQWHKLLRAIERTKREEKEMNRRTRFLWLPSITVLFAAGLILVFLDRAAFLQRIIWIACTAMLLCAAAAEWNRLSYRTRSLWLPALSTFFGASVSLMVCESLGMKPHMVWMSRDAVGHGALLFYWPWLGTLPIFGAIGACLSQRAHGATPARLAASLSPALIMLTVMALVLPFGVAIDGFHYFQLVAVGLGLINWVAIPGAALLVGALPFLRDSHLQEA